VNVVTVEDPIEYRLPGIVQVQVHERAGLTFGAALRSIMRQDPDVILVGEIRDRETAEIAIQASLTGHLVLSTLHTNDAASAVTRLIDIGAASYQIATAVKGVVAQRLVRRLCSSCDGKGCAECSSSGYRGRRAIAEILVASPEFERRVSASATPESIADAARANGCISLWESGLALVRKGETSIEELRRVAAEPVRQITESPPAPSIGTTGKPRIGWWSGKNAAVGGGMRLQFFAAAQSLGDRVDLIVITSESASEFGGFDAIVALGAPPAGSRSTRDDSRSTGTAQPKPLIVTLAPNAATGEHVRMLEREADLVLPALTHGRVILATVLALLRWRAGE
jgi:hypothetical protein